MLELVVRKVRNECGVCWCVDLPAPSTRSLGVGASPEEAIADAKREINRKRLHVRGWKYADEQLAFRVVQPWEEGETVHETSREGEGR